MLLLCLNVKGNQHCHNLKAPTISTVDLIQGMGLQPSSKAYGLLQLIVKSKFPNASDFENKWK